MKNDDSAADQPAASLPRFEPPMITARELAGLEPDEVQVHDCVGRREK